MKSLSLQSIFAILMLLISWAADPQTAFADEAATPLEMEEVTVYGEKSMLSLKRVLIKAEENAYAVFNSLNTNNQYDIRCYKIVPVGTHIPRRVCYANYVKRLRDDAASVWHGNKKGVKSGGPIISVTRMREKEKNLRSIMDELKLEHPELVEALDAYSNAKHRYVTASEEKSMRKKIKGSD